MHTNTQLLMHKHKQTAIVGVVGTGRQKKCSRLTLKLTYTQGLLMVYERIGEITHIHKKKRERERR